MRPPRPGEGHEAARRDTATSAHLSCPSPMPGVVALSRSRLPIYSSRASEANEMSLWIAGTGAMLAASASSGQMAGLCVPRRSPTPPLLARRGRGRGRLLPRRPATLLRRDLRPAAAASPPPQSAGSAVRPSACCDPPALRPAGVASQNACACSSISSGFSPSSYRTDSGGPWNSNLRYQITAGARGSVSLVISAWQCTNTSFCLRESSRRFAIRGAANFWPTINRFSLSLHYTKRGGHYPDWLIHCDV